MAVDMFLKLEGIEGEAKDDTHGGEIDVLSWSWGMANSGSFHTGGGGGAGKVSMRDLNITKYIDSSSNALYLHASNGKHIPSATLTVRKSGENPLEYYIIKLEKLMVVGVDTGGGLGDDRLTENVTLNFAKVSVEYIEQQDDGSGGAAKTYGWDIEKNIAV